MRAVTSGLFVGLCFVAVGCVGPRAAGPAGAKPVELAFEAIQITGDLELEKLNDEELFAGGTAAFAAADHRRAARYFGRLADFHPHSRHRRPSLYNAGLAHERLKEWDQAYQRFSELSDPQRGTGDALDAAFRVAETLYHLERFADAAAVLGAISERSELPLSKRIEAQVQQGICLLEAGLSQPAEAALRKGLGWWTAAPDKDELDDYFPAQAQFFLGEVYRLHYESVQLDPLKGVDQLAQDLESKAELLLSAQGHYLRAIRIGNGHWATAAGAQIGALYENLYEHMVSSPVPAELDREEGEVYRHELRKRIRILITKSINIYERTLEAAERIGAQNAFVARTKESLRKMKELLLADAALDEEAPVGQTSPIPSGARSTPTLAPGEHVPHS
jgi:tetratricopeptide (TPR) repeat protein